MKRWTGTLAIAASVAVVSILWAGDTVNKQEEMPLNGTDLATVVAGNNQFAFELYAQLAQEKGNLFLSPSSISTALAMTYAGARGQTAQEMARTLHFTLESARLNPAFAALLRQWKGEGQSRGYQLSVANALWGQQSFGFLPDFLNLIRKDYGAGLVEVDFLNDTELARKTINEWVEQQTQSKIKDLIQRGVLDRDSKLVLTNAVYFKGNWAAQFDKKLTKDQDFYLTAEDKIKTALMHRTGQYKYADAGTFQALELPYQGSELSMLLLLPKQVDGLGALEKTLSASELSGLLARLHEQEVAVVLPRFQMTRAFRLNDVLAALDMPLAFDPAKADFTGMTESAPLFISAVVHKAFVDVNEEGTEAAAATGVVMAGRALPRVESFRADHPFVFLIRDNRSGSILFLGRVTDPRT